MQMLTDVFQPTENAVVYRVEMIINPQTSFERSKIRATTTKGEEGLPLFCRRCRESVLGDAQKDVGNFSRTLFLFYFRTSWKKRCSGRALFFRADGADVVPYDPAGRNISPSMLVCLIVFFSYKVFIENQQKRDISSRRNCTNCNFKLFFFLYQTKNRGVLLHKGVCTRR